MYYGRKLIPNFQNNHDKIVLLKIIMFVTRYIEHISLVSFALIVSLQLFFLILCLFVDKTLKILKVR